MALLSQMIRTAAITGRPDQVHAWFADKQGARWADQWVQGAFRQPAGARRAPEETRRELADLHARGVLTDEEVERLSARLAT